MGGPARLLNTETSKPKSVTATLGRFWPYFKPRWFALIIVLILLVTVTWTQVFSPELFGQAVDCFFYPQSTCWFHPGFTFASPAADRIAGLGSLALELVGLYIAGAILSGLMFYTMNWAGNHALREIRVDVFNHLQKLSMGFYAENETGNIMSRFVSDADAIQQALGFALVNVMSGVLLIGWVMVKMMTTNLPYALLSLAIVPFMLGATLYFSNQARKAFRKSRAEMGSVNAELQESIAGVREVQAFSREDENIANFQQTNAANRDANIRAAAFTSALSPTLEALGYLALGIVVVAGGLSVLRQEPLLGTTVISLGTVFVFMQYVQRFNQPITQISVMWTNIQNAIAGGERIFGLLDVEPDVVDKADAKTMPQIQGGVEFDQVSAEYKTNQPVLKDVSFKAEPGQMIAIVGPTGAGKTTIINLLPRFYDVSAGAVKIDGIDVRDVTKESLRSQIGIVLQDTFLFSDTVMNNIRYGRLGATDEEVIAAAKLASADTFIERLPDGYQTVLGERGAGLSQGQRQLMAIARAALANPRILILDEATSSVDTRTERLIQAAFEKLLAGRTSFVIAHRLSTIRHADQVFMLMDGQIVEHGTHQELLAKQGPYYDLYMSQFRREEEPSADGKGRVTGEFVPQSGD